MAFAEILRPGGASERDAKRRRDAERGRGKRENGAGDSDRGTGDRAGKTREKTETKSDGHTQDAGSRRDHS